MAKPLQLGVPLSGWFMPAGEVVHLYKRCAALRKYTAVPRRSRIAIVENRSWSLWSGGTNWHLMAGRLSDDNVVDKPRRVCRPCVARAERQGRAEDLRPPRRHRGLP